MRAGKQYVRSQDVVARAIGDELILVPIRDRIVTNQCLFTLNATGTVVWDLLRAPCTVDVIARALVHEFAVSLDRARGDARRFLARLLKEGCAHEVTRAATAR